MHRVQKNFTKIEMAHQKEDTEREKNLNETRKIGIESIDEITK